MTYLFYFSTCFNSTFLGGILDEAITLSKDPNNKVHFVYCDGVLNMCMFNQRSSRALCKICGVCTGKAIRHYNIEALSLQHFVNNTEVEFDYSTSEELREIDYRDVHLGLGIISNYITMTRNLAPAIDAESKKYFDAHLRQGARMIDAIYSVIETIKPDVVYTYNPRFEEFRPVFDICKSLGISCQITEAVKRDNSWRKVIYDNHLPHDIIKRKERREYCWDHYAMTEEEKIEFGKSFYSKRRGGQDSGDKKIYVANQKEGDAPDFDDSKRNIAIMNSSEDEFASIGGDWDKLKLFKTQYDGIIYLLEHAEKNFHFYLRVHPNLTDIPYKFHTDLYKLEEKYDNITVIPAKSNMSTYTIMEKCEKTICFGSTMGVESSFWGKPALLLGPSYYYYDDVVYIPKTKEEMMEMLKADLKPKGNINMIKYGAYTLDNTPVHLPMRNLDCEVIIKHFLGIRYHSSNFLKIFVNEPFTGFIIAVARKLTDNFLFTSYKIPTKEE